MPVYVHVVNPRRRRMAHGPYSIEEAMKKALRLIAETSKNADAPVIEIRSIRAR